MSTSEPAIPPSSSDPSTISTGALGPTAAARSLDSTARADKAPISEGDQTEGVGHCLAGSHRQPVAEQQTQSGPDDHGADVDHRSEPGNIGATIAHDTKLWPCFE